MSRGHPSTRATPQTHLSQGCPAPCSFPACHGGVRGIKGQELSQRHTGCCYATVAVQQLTLGKRAVL